MDIIMLDTRQYDRSITDLYWNTDYIHEISNDAGRSMMGSRQENWFYNELSASSERGAAWRLIGSQTGKYPTIQQVLRDVCHTDLTKTTRTPFQGTYHSDTH